MVLTCLTQMRPTRDLPMYERSKGEKQMRELFLEQRRAEQARAELAECTHVPASTAQTAQAAQRALRAGAAPR